MKIHRPKTRLKSPYRPRLIAIVITVQLLVAMPSAGQEPNTQPTPDLGSALTNTESGAAQRSNDEAQAEYYREQTKALRRGAPQKTFWQNIADNPASIMGVVAALIVALVTLTSFLMNYRVSMNNQTDTQFYEALTRFGDKDSAALRSSAAGILAHMASIQRRNFQWRQPIKSSRSGERVYFTTARNQLITGLLLEENQIALFSIRDALHNMVRTDPNSTLEMVFRANEYLYYTMVYCLAKFFVACGVENYSEISEEQLEEAAFLATLESHALTHLVYSEQSSLAKSLKSQLLAYKVISEEKRGDYLIEARKALNTTFFRLSLVVQLYANAFTNNSMSSFTELYGPLFLVGADLRGVNFHRATLIDAKLWGANLSGADLTGANLIRASLDKARLRGARLAGATLFDTTLEGANWWAADYYADKDESLDETMLENLILLHEKSLRENLERIHPSVLAYLQKHDLLKGLAR